MTPVRLSLRSLAFYWRTNAAVLLGVATAVAVLSGALLVGDSVRGSLGDLVLQRLGSTDQVVVSTGFFGEELAARIESHPDFGSDFDAIAPILMTEGWVTLQTGQAEAGPVRVYGVDDRFWEFHSIDGLTGPRDREALFSPALAEELQIEPDTTVLVRVQRPTDIPLESVYGPKQDVGHTLRVRLRSILPTESLGEFSLTAGQAEVRAVFLPLELAQDELDLGGRVNALLVSGAEDSAATRRLEQILRERAILQDLGLGTRALQGSGTLVLEAEDGLLDDTVVEAGLAAAGGLGLEGRGIFAYLANSLEAGDRRIPYSLVTGLDLAGLDPDLAGSGASGLPRVVLNEWASRDLQVDVGERLTIEYYLWDDIEGLLTRSADFEMAGVVPVESGDADMAPEYPGISDSRSLADWNPPFPIDLGLIRPLDEEYWELYRTTPKAFIPLETARELWSSRYGSLTSIRMPAPDPSDVQAAFEGELGARIDATRAGLSVAGVRAEGLEASRGAINFGEYFVYFSFFLVVSALLLAALFFKLSVEQRVREIGLLRAVGFTPRALRGLFLVEGLAIAVAGALLGALGGVGYAYLIVLALGTWWVDAVGTTALELHVSPVSLIAGTSGGIAAAVICIRLTLGGLTSVSERRLLAGEPTREDAFRRRGAFSRAGIALAGIGVLLLVLALAGTLPDAGGFFGAGTALLAAALCAFVHWSGSGRHGTVEGTGWWSVSRLGLRSVTFRPARSVVSIAMIASATFILISVDAFRREGISDTGPRSGIGGYDLIVESLLPLIERPSTPEGMEALGLSGIEGVRVDPFRLRPGDDASCLNLYEPQNPRIVAPEDSFIDRGRFAFRDALASLGPSEAERDNPWLLLHREFPDGAIPAIADAHSITYVLHRSLGEDIVIHQGDREIRLRLVASLDDSIFQGELIVSESSFRSVFPDQEGYRYLLVDILESGTALEAPDLLAAGALEDALGDLGAEVTTTTQRLAEFHRVENTYLSTFQALGGLGLLLGTVGLGAVLLRNVMERRRELALLRALGYREPQFLLMVVSENALLLVVGLATGLVSAYLAITPALLDRGAILPGPLLIVLLAGVLAAGLITSLIATVAALRSPLLPALRAE